MYKRCVIDTLQQYFVLHENSMILKLNISRHSYSVLFSTKSKIRRFKDSYMLKISTNKITYPQQ